MRNILAAICALCMVLTACQNDVTDDLRVGNPSTELFDATFSANLDKIKGPKNRIKVDFTKIIDQRAVVTITGTAGEGTFVFDSNDGAIQTGIIPRDSRFNVKWEYFAVTPVECNYMLYWNFTGISIYGTTPYGFSEALDVELENKALLTFFKDCGS
jgi:hypothetical protein